MSNDEEPCEGGRKSEMTRRKEKCVSEDGGEKNDPTRMVTIAATALANNKIRNLTNAHNQVIWREKTPPPVSV